MKKNSPESKQVRVVFRDGDEVVTSLWATVAKDVANTVVTLAHEYPDFKPQPGWTIMGRNLNLVVVSVAGQTLTCREV